ncbi:hypothetical protein ACFQE0_12895 [Methylobacterium komagatae]|uniref:Uncharacterized protein n=1 Tax=Methylobacterium komagatae TaxID=374425 RepID=A0ABW2BLD2_9HYPH
MIGALASAKVARLGRTQAASMCNVACAMWPESAVVIVWLFLASERR